MTARIAYPALYAGKMCMRCLATKTQKTATGMAIRAKEMRVALASGPKINLPPHSIMFLPFQTWYTRRCLCLAVAMAGGSAPGPGESVQQAAVAAASALVPVPAVCESCYLELDRGIRFRRLSAIYLWVEGE